MAKKTATKPEIRKKFTKTAVKTAKKPVLRENLSADTSSSSPNPTPKKRGNPQNLVRYEKGDPAAKKNGAIGGTVKQMNARMLKQNAAVVEESGKMPVLIKKALDTAESNPMYSQALLAVVKEAAKLVGAHADQSPDAAQNLNLKADVKKAETVKLVIEDFTKPETTEAEGE